MTNDNQLLSRIQHCPLREDLLPHQPRPVLQFHSETKILITGQTPGRKIHESGIPFDDARPRLREYVGTHSKQYFHSLKID